MEIVYLPLFYYVLIVKTMRTLYTILLTLWRRRPVQMLSSILLLVNGIVFAAGVVDPSLYGPIYEMNPFYHIVFMVLPGVSWPIITATRGEAKAQMSLLFQSATWFLVALSFFRAATPTGFFTYLVLGIVVFDAHSKTKELINSQKTHPHNGTRDL